MASTVSRQACCVRCPAAAGILFSLLLKVPAFAGPEALCGTPYLPSRPIPGAAAKKTAAETFDVGDALTVRVFNFGAVPGTDPYYLTTTTCRLKGERCYIFVEDVIWGGSRVTPAALTSLTRAFDRSTPRYPDRGIYSIDTEIFGPPPDADGDPRIVIVLLDIMDNSLSGTILGYYDTANQAAPVGREILYIDSDPLDLNSDLARATLAHEFQHMLHWNGDPDEDKWVDEGCAEYAELACGYRKTTGEVARHFLGVPNLLKSPAPNLQVPPNTGLTDAASWSGGDFLPFLFDQTFLLTTFFAQRYGDTAVARLVAEPENGIDGFNRALEDVGAEERFEQFWSAWAAAVYVNDDGGLGYRALSLGPISRDTVAVPADDLGGALQLWGIDYVVPRSSGPQGLSLDVESGSDLLVTLVSERDDTHDVAAVPVPRGARRRIGLYGEPPAVLAFTRTSPGSQTYSLSLARREGHVPAAADFDASGTVGFSDFIAFAAGFGKSAGRPGFDPSFDLDGDRTVSFSDFILFARNFGKSP
ncbi:MAG: hypothetical protein OXU79_00355 [Gemmatimonadota bacterium]|nr:hypothetical protein [Gemmatimonadota bacterium]